MVSSGSAIANGAACRKNARKSSTRCWNASLLRRISTASACCRYDSASRLRCGASHLSHSTHSAGRRKLLFYSAPVEHLLLQRLPQQRRLLQLLQYRFGQGDAAAQQQRHLRARASSCAASAGAERAGWWRAARTVSRSGSKHASVRSERLRMSRMQAITTYSGRGASKGSCNMAVSHQSARMQPQAQAAPRQGACLAGAPALAELVADRLVERGVAAACEAVQLLHGAHHLARRARQAMCAAGVRTHVAVKAVACTLPSR